MSVIFRHYQPQDLRADLLDPAVAALLPDLTDPTYARMLQQDGRSWSAFWGAPHPDNWIGAGGLIPVWSGRAIAWLIRARWVPRQAWPVITDFCRTEFAVAHAAGTWRIECHCRFGDAAARRWAQRLGFVAEGLALGYAPDGSTHYLMARVDAAGIPRPGSAAGQAVAA
jgi:hypothetical protein